MIVRRTITSLGAAALALAAGACIPHRPTRTVDVRDARASVPHRCEPRPPTCQIGGTTDAAPGICTSIAALASEQEQRAVTCQALERHDAVAPAAAQADRSKPHDGFDLHVVEFDDEGQLWNPDRQEATLTQLRHELSRRPALVAVFIHGWKNDASVCNGNIACFREVLEVLAKIEHAYPFGGPDQRRRVIGVYVGWRGGAIGTPGVKQLTFWGRKHTAHTIGDNGGVTAFIRRLRTVVNEGREAQKADTPGAPGATSMVLVGHSFGAALLFSALGTSINGDAGAALEAAKRTGVATSRQPGQSQAMVTTDGRIRVRSQGDLVMLVNPAMEASRFANLASAVKLRYDPLQTPILVTLGSEGDSAVKYFFPIGQSLSTVFRAARSRGTWFSMVEGFGLYRPYLTHRLSASAEPLKRKPAPAGSGGCGCKSELRHYGDDLVDALEPYYRGVYRRVTDEVGRAGPQAAAVRVDSLGAYQEFLYSRLEPLTDVDPNTPFLMVQVDRDVVPDHSGIFNARFLDFVVEFTVRSELKRRLQNENLPQLAVATPAAGDQP
jgi:hypothetical protein